MNYKLSIMICNYNNAWCIENALNSIPKRSDIQIVIVDDGSTDNSDEVIRNYIQNNTIFGYKYIKNDENIGLGLTRRVASQFIEGEYFHILDCDDWLIPEKFNEIIDNYLDKNYDIVYFAESNTSAIGVTRSNENNFKNYCGHNKIFKTQFIKDIGAQWNNVRTGSDVDFDRQWWYKNPTMYFTKIIAKHWNRPNERFTNLSMYGAKNKHEIMGKLAEHLRKQDETSKNIRIIIRYKNNQKFIEEFKPVYEDKQYTYKVII